MKLINLDDHDPQVLGILEALKYLKKKQRERMEWTFTVGFAIIVSAIIGLALIL